MSLTLNSRHNKLFLLYRESGVVIYRYQLINYQFCKPISFHLAKVLSLYNDYMFFISRIYCPAGKPRSMDVETTSKR